VRTLIRKLQDTESEKDPSGSNGSKRKLRRHRRNIAHECCKDGCTYDDIMDYCALWSHTRSSSYQIPKKKETQNDPDMT